MQKLSTILCCAFIMVLAAFSASAQTSDDVIRERPDGDVAYYWRTGGAYEYFYGMLVDAPQNGIAGEIVTNGSDVYIKNFLSTNRTGTYVRGTLSDDGRRITVPTGQVIEYWPERGYGIYLSMVTITANVEGASYFSILDDDIVLALTDDGEWRLEATDNASTDEKARAVGALYTDDGSFSGYCDWQTVFHPIEGGPAVPPADLATASYRLNYTLGDESFVRTVSVGFADDKVYMQGLTPELPDGWLVGTVEGGVVTIAQQYAGVHEDIAAFYVPADYTEQHNAETGVDYHLYELAPVLTLQLDASTGVLSTRGLQAMLLNRGVAEYSPIRRMDRPSFTPFDEHPSVPAAPVFVEYDDSRFATKQYSKVHYEISTLDAEGKMLDSDKLSYCFYLDDDEPYVFYADEYATLSEDVVELPYSYADGWDILSPGYIYIYITGFHRIGCQTIYRGGGEEHRSAIVYYNVDTRQVEVDGEEVGVGTVLAPSAEGRSHDLSGRVVDSRNRAGIVIRDGRKTINL